MHCESRECQRYVPNKHKTAVVLTLVVNCVSQSKYPENGGDDGGTGRIATAEELGFETTTSRSRRWSFWELGVEVDERRKAIARTSRLAKKSTDFSSCFACWISGGQNEPGGPEMQFWEESIHQVVGVRGRRACLWLTLSGRTES